MKNACVLLSGLAQSRQGAVSQKLREAQACGFIKHGLVNGV
jgi:hypothetical protein